jgi:hypothetical protein
LTNRSATTTASNGELTIFTGSTAGQTITLPSSPQNGAVYQIKNLSSNAVYINGGTNSLSVSGQIYPPSFTATTAVSNTLTSVSSYSNLVAGMALTSTYVPTGTTITTVNSGTNIIMSASATTAATLQNIKVLVTVPQNAAYSFVYNNSGNAWYLITTTDLAQMGNVLPVTKGGTGLNSIGTANQVLKVNSTATALEWGNAGSANYAIYSGSSNTSSSANYATEAGISSSTRQTSFSSLAVNGDLNISGNAYISGSTFMVSASNISTTDPLIYVGMENPANINDLGIVGSFTSSSYQHTGIVRDHSDGVWKLFSGVTTEPTNVINFASAVYDTLKLGGIIITSSALVSNLNAQYLNGQSSTDYLNTINSASLNAYNAASAYAISADNNYYASAQSYANSASLNSYISASAYTQNLVSSSYQPLDTDLTSIASLTSSGILKRTASSTWLLDVNYKQLYVSSSSPTVPEIGTLWINPSETYIISSIDGGTA